MKIPKVFILEKNLDKKYSHLMINEFEHKEPREVTLEELMKDDMNVLYGGAKGYQRNEITETAISKIIDDTFESKIIWKEDDNNPYTNTRTYVNNYPSVSKKLYRTKATILNYRRERITIPVIFLISGNLLSTWCFLHLGTKQGPCRTTYHKRVKQLATEYFKIDTKDLPK